MRSLCALFLAHQDNKQKAILNTMALSVAPSAVPGRLPPEMVCLTAAAGRSSHSLQLQQGSPERQSNAASGLFESRPTHHTECTHKLFKNGFYTTMHPLHPGVVEGFDLDKYLYHYTTMETALNGILHFKTLRFSPFANVNDPMESDRIILGLFGPGPHEEVLDSFPLVDSFFRDQMKTLCFSLDDQFDPNHPENHFHNYCARGHSKPRMWATYGDDHKGVCLIFDKEILRTEIESQIESDVRLFHGGISYTKTSPFLNELPKFDLEALKADHQKELQRQTDIHKEKWLFSKHIDWVSENEYRFVLSGGRQGVVDLSFGNALVGVVVGKKAEDKPGYLRALADLTQEMEIPCVQLTWNWQNATCKILNSAAELLGPR